MGFEIVSGAMCLSFFSLNVHLLPQPCIGLHAHFYIESENTKTRIVLEI
jgi:hypothetical protein